MQNRVWLISRPRAGSHYIASLLNYMGYNMDHYWITGDHQLIEEPFYPDSNKLHFYLIENGLQRWGMYPSEILEKIGNVKWIYMDRRDEIARLASFYILTLTRDLLGKAYTSTKEDEEIIKNYKFSMKDFMKIKKTVYIWKRDDYPPWWKDFLPKADAFEIIYEDMNDQKIIDLFDFLGHTKDEALNAIEHDPLTITRHINPRLYKAVEIGVKKACLDLYGTINI